MQYMIPDILSGKTLERVRALYDEAEFVDGRESAGPGLKNVKDNEQASKGSEPEKEMSRHVQEALLANQGFINLAMPRRLSAIQFARYGPGKAYNDHIDAAVMSRTNPMRSDLSMTIFLNDGAEYEGGELILNTDLNPLRVKGKEGSGFLYPTYAVHRVAPVTSGVRKVCVMWIQSELRLPEQRQILIDLGRLKKHLANDLDMTHPERVRIEKIIQNLKRMWVEF